MNIESKNKWQIRLATLIIFLLGFAAGASALNAYHLWFGADKRQTRQELYDDAFNNLGLNASQKIEVQKIVGDSREKIQRLRQEDEPRIQEIRTQTDARLQEVLSSEQWIKFQTLREIIRLNEN